MPTSRIEEAVCERCGETFNPTTEEDGYPQYPEHYTQLDGTPCGGVGKITGSWRSK